MNIKELIVWEEQDIHFEDNKCDSCSHFGTTEFCVGTYPADCENYDESEAP